MSAIDPTDRAPYAVISPVRDEAGTFRCTLASVLAQGVRPARWVIVDDGSGAAFRSLLKRIAGRFDFVEVVRLADRGRREPGAGVVRAFCRGLQAIEGVGWEFVGKLDGDVQLPGRYYETVLEAFAAEPRLGIAAGACMTPAKGGFRLERNAPFHTRGPCKVWRRECLEEIGGLAPMLGWDGLDGYVARMRGWTTRTLAGLKVIHFRPTHGLEGGLRGGMRAGRGAYNLHYRPAYLLARVAVNLFHPPLVLGGLGLAAGFLASHLVGEPRLDDPELVAFIRAEQGGRLRRLARGGE